MATVFVEYSVDFWAIGALPLAVVLDLALGQPRWMPNPIRLIPPLIERAEGGGRVIVATIGGGPWADRAAGLVLVSTIVGLVGGLGWLAVEVFDGIGGPALMIGRALLIYWGISIRQLGDEILRVSLAPELASNRRLASTDVRIDSNGLDKTAINRACLESLGERATIEVIGPLFWLAIAGPAGLWAYKAIDGLYNAAAKDTPRSRQLGWAVTWIDDLANFVPSRLTWLLIALSAALVGEDGLASIKAVWRLRRRFPGRQEIWGVAALAGALGVQLGGGSRSRGSPRRMPIVGELNGPIDIAKVRRGVRVAQVAGLHAAALAWTFRIVIYKD